MPPVYKISWSEPTMNLGSCLRLIWTSSEPRGLWTSNKPTTITVAPSLNLFPPFIISTNPHKPHVNLNEAFIPLVNLRNDNLSYQRVHFSARTEILIESGSQLGRYSDGIWVNRKDVCWTDKLAISKTTKYAANKTKLASTNIMGDGALHIGL